MASGSLPKLPVSSSLCDEVPHIFIRKTHLHPREFLISSGKGLLQHNRHLADIGGRLHDVCLSNDSVAKLVCFWRPVWAVSFCYTSVPLPIKGVATSTHRYQCLTQRLRRASSCERRWGTAEQFDESFQVLRGCGEQHLVPGTAQSSQTEPVEPEDALHMCKPHLNLLALSR